ncbi:hypothetical protein [Variovorax guangxiensis]|uniref:hypothetical protein n=1 Tax=Variovorax guangxiensis TaxID=1775474 RepID=UPI002865F5D6|nr:hypothetical protein [Variovorax guangxiensis]MDR6857726.1 hypothetical protein [Variovorax guangxiensis]
MNNAPEGEDEGANKNEGPREKIRRIDDSTDSSSSSPGNRGELTELGGPKKTRSPQDVVFEMPFDHGVSENDEKVQKTEEPQRIIPRIDHSTDSVSGESTEPPEEDPHSEPKSDGAESSQEKVVRGDVPPPREQPTVTDPQASTRCRVPAFIRNHPCGTTALCLAFIGAAAIAGGLFGTKTTHDLTPETDIQKFTRLVGQWLFDCGLPASLEECYSYAEAYAYTWGDVHSNHNSERVLQREWISERLWAQCPSTSLLDYVGSGGQDIRNPIALGSAAAYRWAEEHRQLYANGTPAAMIQWLVVMVAVALHAFLLG